MNPIVHTIHFNMKWQRTLIMVNLVIALKLDWVLVPLCVQECNREEDAVENIAMVPEFKIQKRAH